MDEAAVPEFFETQRHFSSPESSAPLAALGLDAQLLTEAVRSGVSGAQNITAFHPVTARGLTQWSETVAFLRSALDERGWQATNPQNSPRVTSPDGKTSLMVAGGDHATGVPHGTTPRTARGRGPATRSAVECNGQLAFDIPLTVPLSRNLREPFVWVLLYHWSKDEPEVRAELSLPTVLDPTTGVITDWAARILLPTQPLDDFEISQRPGGHLDEVNFRIEDIS